MAAEEEDQRVLAPSTLMSRRFAPKEAPTGRQPGALKTISQGKLATFAVGQQKKSRFQRAKEEKEERKKKEAEEAAEVYESFVASFEAEGSKTFVRGEGVNDKHAGTSENVNAIGKTYQMNPTKRSRMQEEGASSHFSMDASSRPFPSSHPSSQSASTAKKMTNMAQMLEEMKERDMERTSSKHESGRARSSSRDFTVEDPFQEDMPRDFGGSFPTGDPHTTNLYVGNLSPTTSEDMLCETFGQFGPINSCKIMWPRSEEERSRGRNCGFVSFVRRADAEDALAELNDYILEGHRLTVGWGKAVKILPTPRYVHPSSPPAERIVDKKRPREWDSSEAPHADEKKCDDKIVVALPQCPEQRRIIDTVAQFVAEEGDAFEQALLQRESSNPQFSFLLPENNRQCPSALRTYYRWRVVAYLNGDGHEQWRESPFQLMQNGPLWFPPKSARSNGYGDASSSSNRQSIGDTRDPSSRVRSRSRSRSRERPEPVRQRKDPERSKYAGMTGAQIERAKAKDHTRSRLSQRKFDHFQQLLDSLTLQRESIKDAMGFALDHTESAEDVVHILIQSILSKQASPPLKIARLYLLSDILHNSGAAVKNASLFRSHIQASLPTLFDQLNDWKRGHLKGRMSLSQFEDRVLRVLAIWADWTIFPATYLVGLEALLFRSDADVDRIKDGCEGCSNPLEDDESVRRRARFAGLPTTAPPSAGHLDVHSVDTQQLLSQLAYVEEFSKTRSSLLRSDDAPEESLEHTEEAPYSASVSQSLPVDGGENVSDSEDVDGVPIDDLDDDVDGVPLSDDELDGIPLDE